MRCPSIAIMSLLLTAQLLMPDPSHGFDFFAHHQRTKARMQSETGPGCAREPFKKYNYTSNSWPFTKDRKFSATVIAVAATDPTMIDRSKKIKPFHFRATSIVVDPLILDQVGLSLEETGQLIATGRINHTGGDGGLIGANVTVHIRAYVSHTNVASVPERRPATAANTAVSSRSNITPGSTAANPIASELYTIYPDMIVRRQLGQIPKPIIEAGAMMTVENVKEVPNATPNSVTRIPPDAYRVWSSTQKFWVSRGAPQHVKLANEGDSLHALSHHFDEITHIEVMLEYERDR